jgi:aspartate/methionine/tyrosine aminotransferase
MTQMHWRRMPMEEESPEELGYDTILSNLAESSCTDLRFSDLWDTLDKKSLNDAVLLYGDHRGHKGLRRIIAGDARAEPDDVLVTMGAVMALFVVHTATLGPGEEIVVVRPNYATNLETPFALGADIRAIDVHFDDGYRLNVDDVARAVTKRTRLVSITTPHNPTGVSTPRADVERLIELTRDAGCLLLVDETYREMVDVGTTPGPLWAHAAPHVVSVSSVSKTYGAPGLRTGWLVCTNKAVMKRFLAVKEQITLVGSILDEEITFQLLSQRHQRLPEILRRIAVGKRTVEMFVDGEPRLQWVRPDAGVVGFLRFAPQSRIDVNRFYAHLATTKTMVGPGHWFSLPDTSFRLGWGWPSPGELAVGLRSITAALDVALNSAGG